MNTNEVWSDGGVCKLSKIDLSNIGPEKIRELLNKLGINDRVGGWSPSTASTTPSSSTSGGITTTFFQFPFTVTDIKRLVNPELNVIEYTDESLNESYMAAINVIQAGIKAQTDQHNIAVETNIEVDFSDVDNEVSFHVKITDFTKKKRMAFICSIARADDILSLPDAMSSTKIFKIFPGLPNSGKSSISHKYVAGIDPATFDDDHVANVTHFTKES